MNIEFLHTKSIMQVPGCDTIYAIYVSGLLKK